MGFFNTAGTRLKASDVTTSAIDTLDVPKVLTFDIYQTRSYGLVDPKPEGSVKSLFKKAGEVVTQRQINNWFRTAVISTISPATGGVAGGTVVTIKGYDFDGTTSVTFGGTAGTALTVVNERTIKVTTPAKAAGAYDVVVVDDGGSATKTAGFTYA